MIGFQREELPEETPAVVREDPDTGKAYLVVDSRLPKDEATAAARAAWRAYRKANPDRGRWGIGVLLPGAVALAAEPISRILRRAARSRIVAAGVTAAAAATITALVAGQLHDDTGTGALRQPTAPPPPTGQRSPAPPQLTIPPAATPPAGPRPPRSAPPPTSSTVPVPSQPREQGSQLDADDPTTTSPSPVFPDVPGIPGSPSPSPDTDQPLDRVEVCLRVHLPPLPPVDVRILCNRKSFST